MTYNLKNNNTLNGILNEEIQTKAQLEEITIKSNNSNICDFTTIKLQNKINKLHNEVKNIMLGKPDNDNSIA